MENLRSEFARYEEELKKYNVSLWDFDNLNDNYVITMKTETFEKLGRKHFPKKPTSEKVETITPRQYALYLTSISFFKDRVTKGYTVFGYKPTKISCTNPNNEIKIVRSFRFEYK